jgi:GcrA cell cycle regulator
MDWTQEQIADLMRLWNEGLSTSEIGKRLGITKNAVVGKAHRLHLSARPSPIKRVALRLPLVKPALPKPAMTTAPVASPAAQPAPQTAPTSAPKRAVEMTPHSCRWPIGHPGDSGFHFCGDSALPGKPYCSTHAAAAYVKVKPKTGEAA